MKIVMTSLAALALCLAVSGAAAEDSRISVVFAQPGQYTDLKTTCVTHAQPVTPDQLRYETALLLDWLQRELREPAGS